jgi:hypothetical protein
MVVNPLIDKKFGNFKTSVTHQLELLTKLPDEAIRPALLSFIEILKKENRRLALHQARTRRWRERHGDGSCKLLINNNERHGDGEEANPFILNEERHSNGVTVTVPLLSKKESKRERVSPKRSIPEDLLCSERNKKDASKIGMEEAVIVFEWDKFKDYHLGKGTLGKNWDANWRNWCRKHIGWKKEDAKKLPQSTYNWLDQIPGARNG